MIKKLHRGISLLELMLSLTIIAILLVTATRFYQVTRTSEQVNEASDMILAVYSAAGSWLQDHGGFSANNMIQNFIDNGSLPNEYSLPNTNPWNGDVQAAGGAPGASPQIKVSLGNIPRDACQNLMTKFIALHRPNWIPACDYANLRFSVTFYFQ